MILQAGEKGRKSGQVIKWMLLGQGEGNTGVGMEEQGRETTVVGITDKVGGIRDGTQRVILIQANGVSHGEEEEEKEDLEGLQGTVVG